MNEPDRVLCACGKFGYKLDHEAERVGKIMRGRVGRDSRRGAGQEKLHTYRCTWVPAGGTEPSGLWHIGRTGRART